MLCAVFVPSAFITGISGQFYRQFALTIAGATVISLIVSLTLSPALCALLLKPHRRARARSAGGSGRSRGFFGVFNWGFDKLARGLWLARGAGGALHRDHAAWSMPASSPSASTSSARRRSASSRQLDRGYLIVVAQLPPGASLSRTDEVQRRIVDIALKMPGVIGAVNIVGFSGATFTNAPNAGAAFLVLDSFEKRAKDPNQSAAGIQRALFGKLAAIQEALIFVVPPPPVHGHRQRRRLPHDDRGPRRPRAARRCERRPTP